MLGQAEYDSLRLQFEAAMAVSSEVEDGVILAVTALQKLSSHEIRSFFQIGSGRPHWLCKASLGLTATNAHFTPDEFETARGCIMAWKAECGFACPHKWQREYLDSGAFSQKWKEYRHRQEDDGLRSPPLPSSPSSDILGAI